MGRAVVRLFRFHPTHMRQLLLALPLLLIACGTTSQQTSSLPPAAFQARLAEPGAQLIDARTSAEFNSGHLDGALNLDWNGGQLEAAEGSLDKSKPVLLYCASGRRSAAARDFLQAQGFSDVMDLQGGVQAWAAAGMAIAN